MKKNWEINNSWGKQDYFFHKMANHARSLAYMLSRYIELENVNVTIFFVSSPEIVIQLNKW